MSEEQERPKGWRINKPDGHDGWVYFRRPDGFTQAITPDEPGNSHAETLYMLLDALSAPAPHPVAPSPTDAQIDDALEEWFASGPVGIEHKTDRTRMRAAILAATPTEAPAEPAVMDCEDCNGTGEVGEEIYQGDFQPPERDRCSSCDGSGKWKVETPAERDSALTDAYAEGRKDEREAAEAEPIAWESTTPVYRKFITQGRYEKFSAAAQRWYKPYRCSACEAVTVEAERALQLPEALSCLESVMRAASHVLVGLPPSEKEAKLRSVLSKAHDWCAAERAALAAHPKPAAHPPWCSGGCCADDAEELPATTPPPATQVGSEPAPVEFWPNSYAAGSSESQP